MFSQFQGDWNFFSCETIITRQFFSVSLVVLLRCVASVTCKSAKQSIVTERSWLQNRNVSVKHMRWLN